MVLPLKLMKITKYKMRHKINFNLNYSLHSIFYWIQLNPVYPVYQAANTKRTQEKYLQNVFFNPKKFKEIKF